MGTFFTLLKLVARRSFANRALLSTVAIGVVLSAALMASVVLYSETIRDLGLRYGLESEEKSALDIQIMSSSQPVTAEEYRDRERKTRDILAAQAGEVLGQVVRYGRTATFFPTAPGEAVDDANEKRMRAQFHFMSDASDHLKLVEGQAPAKAQRPSDTSAAPSIEVLLGAETARALNIAVGTKLDLHPYWKPEAEPVQVVITGLVEPKDPDEAYWFGRAKERFIDTETSYPNLRLWVDETTLPDVLAAYLPGMDGTFETFGLVDLGKVTSRNARVVEDRTRALEYAMKESVTHTTVKTELPRALEQYRTKLFFTRLPLFALMLQVVGIVLYYLVMVATMLVERQSGEIALLKSRGAGTLHIMAVYGLEGLLLCAGAAIIGPLAAAAAISALGVTPPFNDLSGNDLLDVPLSGGAFAMAAFGAALALLAMLWPAWRAARQTIIHYRQELSRPSTQPLFLKYYLDLVLVGAGAIAFYQLRQRGSFVTEKLFGDLSADPLLLISPTLFMFMIALVFLRIFPQVLKLAAWGARRLNGPTINLGLWRMVRAPLHYSRLILLLLLCTAVGMFAAGFRATLDRSYDDRASYEAGAEGRIDGFRKPVEQTNETLAATVREATGASEVMPAARLDGSYSPTRYRSIDTTVLGVVPDQLEEVAYWRDDFAGDSLGRLMDELAPPPAAEVEPIIVPAGTTWMGLWAQVPLPGNAFTLGVRLRDPGGATFDYSLFWGGLRQTTGNAVREGWQFYAIQLGAFSRDRRIEPTRVPLTVEAVYLRTQGAPPQTPEKVSVLVDGLQVSSDSIDAPDPALGFGGRGQIIEGFDDIARYEVITGASAYGDPGAISRAAGAGVEGSAGRIAFTRERGMPVVLGMRTRGLQGPVPLLASDSFLAETERKVGDEIQVYVNRQYIQAHIVGHFELFPSFIPDEGEHLLVADLETLERAAGNVPVIGGTLWANSAWLGDVSPGALDAARLKAKGIEAEGVYDRAVIRAEQGSDPLVAASWEGILFLAFAAVLGLTALGFAVYASIAAQARSLEFAILRTMGYSSVQVLSLVTFEQLFVVVTGVTVGTIMGFPMGRLMIGYLGVTESGQDPVPPLVSEVSTEAVVAVYALLALVFLGTILSLAMVYTRLAVGRALRIGEA